MKNLKRKKIKKKVIFERKKNIKTVAAKKKK